MYNNFLAYPFMSFYIYQPVEPLFLSNILISLSTISHPSHVISYQLFYQLSVIFIKPRKVKRY